MDLFDDQHDAVKAKHVAKAEDKAEAAKVKQAKQADEPKSGKTETVMVDVPADSTQVEREVPVVEVPMAEPQDHVGPHNPEDAIVHHFAPTEIRVPEGEFKATNKKSVEEDGQVIIERTVDGVVVATYIVAVDYLNDDVTADIAIEREIDRIKANLLTERK